MKKTLLLFGLLIILSPVFAQAPDGYYNSAENKSDSELKTALHNIIKSQIVYSYDQVWDQLKYTDEDPTNPNNVILLYSGWSYPKDDNGGEVAEWNREHTWAKSQGNFGTSNGPGTDLHHLRPTDVTVNSKRDNLYFDNGGTLYIDGSRYGGGDGNTHCYYDSDSWEPQDSVKGDVARMLFYMAVRYESEDMVDLELAEYSSTSGLHGKLSTLLQWNRQDPVGAWEIRRNNRIYERQENRNPFIDHPELAEYIWGNKKGEIWTLSGSGSTDPTLYSPNSGSTVDFGTVIYQQNTTKTITVTGSNLTGDLNLTLSGNDASYFSIPVTTISKTDAQTGYNLIISYNAPVTGSHSAVLTISGGGITTTTVNLTATATDCSGLSFSVPFTTTISPFTEYSITGDQIWVNSYSSATMTGYVSSTNYANEDWLISPQIDFKDYNNLILAFDYVTRYFNDPVTDCTIWISDNYISGVPNTASWTQLNPPTPFFNASSWTFSPSGNIDLNAYKDQKVNIAFKYISTSTKAGTWEIQNLNITGDCNSTFVKDILNDNKHKVISENKNLHIFELKNEDIAIYNIYGIKLFYKTNASGNTLINNLQTGIYIIRAGNDTQKAIVK